MRQLVLGIPDKDPLYRGDKLDIQIWGRFLRQNHSRSHPGNNESSDMPSNLRVSSNNKKFL